MQHAPLRKRNPTAVPRSYTYYSLLKLKGASLQHLLTAHLYTDFLNFLIKFSVGDDKDVDSALRVPGLGEVLKLD
uniref:Uncharacterized protein n=1 Tax=Ignisphaera aggregans TaxID=334771 RepID=A0A7C4BC44_9CREN